MDLDANSVPSSLSLGNYYDEHGSITQEPVVKKICIWLSSAFDVNRVNIPNLNAIQIFFLQILHA